MSNLGENILATLAYYNIFDFPLTSNELLAYLVNFKHLKAAGNTENYTDNLKPKIEEIKKELDQIILDGIVQRREEYYFLFGREYLVPLRLKRKKIANQKWQTIRRAVRWLQLIPSVQAIFASGSLAMNNTDELSDLDVFIVAKNGQIWLSRILILGITSLLGMRRKGTDRIAPNKICTNHFVTEGSLNIPFKSMYTAQTYSNLVPIFTKNKIIIQEFKKENSWVLDYVYGWNMKNDPMLKPGPMTAFSKIEDMVLGMPFAIRLENLARNYQLKRITKSLFAAQGRGRIIFNDNQLEFHPHSIENTIIPSYNNHLNLLGLSELAVEKNSGLDNVIHKE